MAFPVRRIERQAATQCLAQLMPRSFEPRLDILPKPQRLLWPELDAVPSNFVLYGATFINRSGPVKIAFFGGFSDLRRVSDPALAAGSNVLVASLIDLAGMKMRVIQARGSWKDYIDIHELVCNGVEIPTGLAAARAIDPRFNPAISVRALQYFGDGTLHRVPVSVQRDLARWAQAVNLSRLPFLRPSPGGLV